MTINPPRHSEALAAWGGWDAHAKGHLVHPAVSLVVIVGLIGASVAASLAFPERKDGAEVAGGESDGPHEPQG
jgi:hypothetical protein